MAIKYTFLSGDTMELNPTELKEVIDLGILAPLAPSVQTNVPQQNDSSTVHNNIDIFKKALQGDAELERILRYIASQGNTGSIPKKDLQANTGKDSLSGMGRVFHKLTGFSLAKILIKLNPITNMYKISNYRDLVDAIGIFDKNTMGSP